MIESPKPAVLPVTVWANSGWFVGTAAAALVHGHLEGVGRGGVTGDFLHGIPTGERGADFRIRWPDAGHVPLRVRLSVRDVPEQGGSRNELPATAGRPRAWEWPSSPALLGTPDLLWDVCDQSTAVRFAHPNPVPGTAGTRDWLRETSASPSSISVLVHAGDRTTFADTRVLEGLPPGLTGRVLEHRVFGAQRLSVNRLVRSTGVKLPEGGALILPSRPPRSAINPETLAVKGDLTRDTAPLLDAVVRYANEPWPTSGRVPDRVHHLRTAWLAESDAERAVTEELRDARARFAAVATRIRSGALAAALHAVGRRLRAAERDAEATEELLDAQSVEIVHLRSQLAAPRPASARALTELVPNNWEDLAHQTRHECVHLVLADITETTRPLRGHPLEQVWIRRTWQTLGTLNSYAAAKTAHGPQLLPHLGAYLRWPDAATLFPATRHAPRESSRLMASPRLHEARCFPVPHTIHPSGLVFMGEHVRIGSGRPPAPRLHLYDDTGGRTGQIHIGYIGTHLPSLRTS